MKKLTTALVLALAMPVAAEGFYAKVGIGYKIKEMTIFEDRTLQKTINDPLTARIELGTEISKNISIGVSHHSQWFTGAPFNNDKEYSKTELFIDYKFEL